MIKDKKQENMGSNGLDMITINERLDSVIILLLCYGFASYLYKT